MCELCGIIQDKERRGKNMVKKSCSNHEEVIDVFHDRFYITTIE